MKLGKLALIFNVVLSLTSGVCWAQSNLQGDVLSAKGYLEDLIIRRLTSDLSTMITSDQFQISVQLDLTKRAEPKRNLASQEPLFDLDLGFLDPEALLKNYTEGQASGAEQFLAAYLVRQVRVQLGLSEGVSEKVKEEVTAWLTQRVEGEFGKSVKVSVITTKAPTALAPASPRSNLDMLKDFQQFAGLALLALALLMTGLLVAVLSKGKGDGKGSTVNVSNQLKAGESDGGDKTVRNVMSSPEEEIRILEKTKEYRESILDLATEVTGELENIVKEWCQRGEEGLFRIACFAEIVGKSLGRLPVPSDYREDIAELFTSMGRSEPKVKLEAYEHIYWDLVAAVNLGSETLHRPFSFLGTAEVGTVSQVLMENDATVKTVASLYMPDSLRSSFLATMKVEQKRELLQEAAKLSEISEQELGSLESKLAPYFVSEKTEKSVSLAETVTKLIDALSISEACVVLPEVTGPAMEAFKRTHGHLAFLPQWPEVSLKVLLSRAPNDELTAYLRVMPSLTDKVMEMIPPMAKKILTDDLATADTMQPADKEELLKSLHKRVVEMAQLNEVNLSEIFAVDTSPGESHDQAA